MLAGGSFIRRVYDFWTRPIRAEPLALFRIILSAMILISLLTSLVPYFDLYLAPDGICPQSAMDPWMRHQGRFSLFRGPINVPFLEHNLPPHLAAAWRAWGETRSAANTFLVIWMLSLIGLMLGWKTRACSIIAWLMAVTFHTRLSWVLNGGDSLMRAGLFYLMLSPAGAVWSLDQRRCGPANGPVTIPPWSVRLMQIQLCLVYFFTGIAKFGPDWFTGEAVYWVLNDTSLTRWPYHFLPVPLVVCRLSSWLTLLWEISFPVLMLWPASRRLALALGVAFHLGIFLTMEIGWFSQVTICWYLVFLEGETVVAALRRLHILAPAPALAPAPGPC